MTPDTSGPESLTPLAYYDPASSSWRTSPGTSPSGSPTFSGTLPASGSMLSGALYERPTSAPPTAAPVCSSLLGTPNAHPRTHDPRQVDHGAQLANQVVALLPTPSAEESTPTDAYLEECRAAGVQPDARLYLPGRRWHSQRTLSRIVPALLPTPAASDGPRGPDYERAGRDGSGGDDLVTTMARLLPTPTTSDAKGPSPNHGGTTAEAIRDLLPTPRATRGGSSTETRDVLLPTPTTSDFKGSTSPASAKAWDQRGTNLPEAIQLRRQELSGVPTGPPSTDGKLSPEPELLTLWTTEDD